MGVEAPVWEWEGRQGALCNAEDQAWDSVVTVVQFHGFLDQ